MRVGRMMKNMLLRLGVCVVASLLWLTAARAAPPEESKAAVAPGLPEHHVRVREVVEDLIKSGETDVDELVDSIATESLGKLDHLVINLATQTIYECNAV